jgi:glyoxylase-like metal-dependent hydrolase (beta-lactamase superfamily II)
MLHTIKLPIANIYIITAPRVVIVDTGAPESTTRILAELRRLGYQPQDVAAIVLTHAHSDHAGSALALRAATGAPVAVHTADVAMLQQGDNGAFVPTDLEAKLIQRFIEHRFPPLEPDIVFDHERRLDDLGIAGRLLHTPGHTPGSVSLLLDGGDAIAGDLLRGGFAGGAFAPGVPKQPFFLYNLDDIDQIVANVRRLIDLGARRLLVGHGGPLGRAAVERWAATARPPQPARVSSSLSTSLSR